MEREKAEYEAAQRKAEKERREATDARKRMEEHRALHSIAQVLQFYLLCHVDFSFFLLCYALLYYARKRPEERRALDSIAQVSISQFSCITTTKKYHQ
jgi:hypothetical protein